MEQAVKLSGMDVWEIAEHWPFAAAIMNFYQDYGNDQDAFGNMAISYCTNVGSLRLGHDWNKHPNRQQFDAQVVDAIFYDGERKPKPMQNIKVLVEAKRQIKDAWGDREKLLGILTRVGRYGVICGAILDRGHDDMKKRSEAVGDWWFECPFRSGDQQWFYAASVMELAAPFT